MFLSPKTQTQCTEGEEGDRKWGWGLKEKNKEKSKKRKDPQRSKCHSINSRPVRKLRSQTANPTIKYVQSIYYTDRH